MVTVHKRDRTFIYFTFIPHSTERTLFCAINYDLYYIDNIGLSSSPSRTINLVDNLVTIFPNPVDDKLFIKSKINDLEYHFAIYDSKGLLVKKGRIYNSKSINDINIDLSSGLYNIVIQSKNNMITKKLSIK